VQRLLKAQGARDFAGISAALPSETRMYVPKVCATIAIRTGVTPDKLPAPHSVALLDNQQPVEHASADEILAASY
jgi:hypothetical protein